MSAQPPLPLTLAGARPVDLLELAEAIDAVSGDDAVNITVSEIDMETVGMEVTVEGECI